MNEMVLARAGMVFVFPAAAALYVRSVYRVFMTAVDTTGALMWWSLSPVWGHLLDHALLFVLVPVLAGCITWVRYFDDTWVEAIFSRATMAGITLSIGALAIGVIVMNLFGAVIILGTASGLMIIVSLCLLYGLSIMLF